MTICLRKFLYLKVTTIEDFHKFFYTPKSDSWKEELRQFYNGDSVIYINRIQDEPFGRLCEMFTNPDGYIEFLEGRGFHKVDEFRFVQRAQILYRDDKRVITRLIVDQHLGDKIYTANVTQLFEIFNDKIVSQYDCWRNSLHDSSTTCFFS